MRKETVEQRAVKIAAKIMVAAGLCRYETPMKCGKAYVCDSVCDKCIRSWLLSKARAALKKEEEQQAWTRPGTPMK